MTGRGLFVLLLVAVGNNLVQVWAQQQQLYLGDDCTLDNGGSGVCKRDNRCPYAQWLIQNGNSPQMCNNDGVALVCCPSINMQPTQGRRARPPPRTREPLTEEPNTIKPTPETSQSRDECTLDNGDSGTCKPVNKCPYAIGLIKKRSRPQVCYYVGSLPMVCCPSMNARNTLSTSKVELPSWRPSIPSPKPAIGKSWAKCLEYANVVDAPEDGVTEASFCSSQAQIINGEECMPKEFPHMAALGFGDEPNIAWKCGGSLISEDFVLTAAHCLFARQLGKVKWVLLGDLDLVSSEDFARPQLMQVIETIKHPGYNYRSYYNDIALLRLNRRVTFNAFVRPACLHTSPVISHKSTATAVGWGVTHWAADTLSDQLMKAALQFHPAQRCNDTFKYLIESGTKLTKGFNETTMICAGDLENERDTCVGDSGGPLQQSLSDPYCMYSIVGITSFGSQSCGLSKSPAVYTRVSYYIPWIESIVWP